MATGTGSPTCSRVATRTAALVTAAAAILAAAPAGAAVPEGWSDPVPLSALENLGLFVLAPGLVIGGVTLLYFLPRLVRIARSAPSVTEAAPVPALSGGTAERPAELPEAQPASTQPASRA